MEKKSLKKEDRFEVPKICLEAECCIPLSKSIDECTDNLDFLRKIGEILALLAPNVIEGKVSVENFFNCTMKLVHKPHAIAVLGGTISINQYLKAQNSSADITGTPTGKAMTW